LVLWCVVFDQAIIRGVSKVGKIEKPYKRGKRTTFSAEQFYERYNVNMQKSQPKNARGVFRVQSTDLLSCKNDQEEGGERRSPTRKDNKTEVLVKRESWSIVTGGKSFFRKA